MDEGAKPIELGPWCSDRVPLPLPLLFLLLEEHHPLLAVVHEALVHLTLLSGLHPVESLVVGLDPVELGSDVVHQGATVLLSGVKILVLLGDALEVEIVKELLDV